MEEEWKEYKLCEVAQLLTGFPFDGHKYSKAGIRVVRGDNVTIGSLRWESEKDKRWNERFSRSNEFSLKEEDIVIGMDGSRVGRNRAQIKAKDLPLLLAQRVACIRNTEKSIQKFLYYQIFSNKFEAYIKSVQTGTSIPHVSLKQIGNFPTSIPSINTQRRIADILSSLDSKIELNRRINDNLEQQTQALFKSWFVDNPKPNWSETTFSEVANFIGGYSYKGEELTDSSNIAMVTIKNFGRNGGFKADGFKGIAPFVKLKECHYANLFDILVAHTDLTQNADVIGNAELLLTYGRYDGIIFSMDLVKVLPKNNFPYRFLLAAMLKNKIFKGHCLGYVNGTTVLHLSKKALPNFEVKIPPKAEAKTMNDALAPYYQRMAEVLQENDRLIHLRDTLLPKLMSGELNINAKSRLQ